MFSQHKWVFLFVNVLIADGVCAGAPGFFMSTQYVCLWWGSSRRLFWITHPISYIHIRTHETWRYSLVMLRFNFLLQPIKLHLICLTYKTIRWCVYFQVVCLESCCHQETWIMAQSLVHIATYFCSLRKKSDNQFVFVYCLGQVYLKWSIPQ